MREDAGTCSQLAVRAPCRGPGRPSQLLADTPPLLIPRAQSDRPARSELPPTPSPPRGSSSKLFVFAQNSDREVWAGAWAPGECSRGSEGLGALAAGFCGEGH